MNNFVLVLELIDYIQDWLIENDNKTDEKSLGYKQALKDIDNIIINYFEGKEGK